MRAKLDQGINAFPTGSGGRDGPIRSKPDRPSFNSARVGLRQNRAAPFAIIPSRISTDPILHIANRFCDLVPRRRDQKLLPHFGEAGAAVCLIKNVEYGWHRLVWSFELICTVSTYLHSCWGPRCELVHTSTRLRFSPSTRSGVSGRAIGVGVNVGVGAAAGRVGLRGGMSD